jgi:hypothetical protein
MLRLAEILLEPRPDATWAQLRQIGVEEAVGVLPRGATDWRGRPGGTDRSRSSAEPSRTPACA